MWSLTEGFYFVNKVSAPAVSYRELIGDEGGSETCWPRSLEAQDTAAVLTGRAPRDPGRTGKVEWWDGP